MKTPDHFNFNGKKVLIRVDFNVPLDENFKITDDSRMKAALPTIRKVLSDGGNPILMSHLGRPKEGFALKYSLVHLVDHLRSLTGSEVVFSEDCIGEIAKEKTKNLKNNQILLLENLRFHKEEEKGDPEFSKLLSENGDFYINDAYGTAHRAHASTTIVAQFFPGNKCFGYLMVEEVKNIEKVLSNAIRPFTAIMGGAKVSDKVLIIENLLGKVDNLLIGGGMAYTFFKALGGNIGNSLVETERLELASEIIEKAKKQNVNLVLPVDSRLATSFSNDADSGISESNHIPDGQMGLDIGDKAINEFSSIIKNSKTILWNGPMGVFEFENFRKGSKEIALAIAEATSNGAYSLIGGGDSVAAINKFGLNDQVSYISTGGGAMLESLEGKILPGVAAMMEE